MTLKTTMSEEVKYKKKYCFDHILGAMIRKGMGENESARDVCFSCEKDFVYSSV